MDKFLAVDDDNRKIQTGPYTVQVRGIVLGLVSSCAYLFSFALMF